MYDSDSKGISYTAGFFMLIAFTIAGILIGGMAGLLAWKAITGVQLTDITEAMKNPAYSNASKISQAISALVGFLLPAWVTASMLNRQPANLLGFKGSISVKQTGLVVFIMLAGMAVSSSLGYLGHNLPYPSSWIAYFDKLEKAYTDQVIAILGLNSPADFIFSLVVMAFLPALCEETLFRGGFQNFLTRSTGKPWIAIVTVSIIFSVVHLSGYGFPARLFLGIVLGAIYYYSGRLWLSILAHFLNNAIALSAIYYYKLQGQPLSKAMEESTGTYWGLALIPVVILLIVVFERASAERKAIG